MKKTGICKFKKHWFLCYLLCLSFVVNCLFCGNDVSRAEPDGEELENKQYIEQFQKKGRYCCVIYPKDDNYSEYTPSLQVGDNDLPLSCIRDQDWEENVREVPRGIDYNIVIDPSRNSDLSSFEKIKKGIEELNPDSFGPYDTIRFFVLGAEGVRYGVKYTANELNSEILEDVLEGVGNVRNEVSSLYVGLKEIIERVSNDDIVSGEKLDSGENNNEQTEKTQQAKKIKKEKEEPGLEPEKIIERRFSGKNRRVVIVITAGYDDEIDESSKNKIKRGGIPVYPVILSFGERIFDENKKEDASIGVDRFVSLCEETGGRPFLYKSDTMTDWDNETSEDGSIEGKIRDEYGNSSVVSGLEDICFHLNSDYRVAYFNYTLSIPKSEGHSIKLLLKGTTGEAVYSLGSEKNIGESSTDQLPEEPTTAQINTESSTEPTTDSRTELNSEQETAERYPEGQASSLWGNAYFWIIALLIALLVVCGIVIIVALRSRKKKKTVYIKAKRPAHSKSAEHRNVQGQKKETVVPDSKATDARRKGIPVQLRIREETTEVREKTVYINGSAIFGRGEGCDVFLEGAAISRQHFVIEYNNGEFYIQDLETMNGTYLNGIRLSHKIGRAHV